MSNSSIRFHNYLKRGDSMDIFVARQAIFNKRMEVTAYELLYRNENNYYCATDGDFATSEVINNSFMSMDISNITFGKKAYINFTELLLKNKIPKLFKSDLIAVELLEEIKFDGNLLLLIKDLKKSGYTIVLDDFVFSDSFYLMEEFVDIIKIDLLGTDKETCKNIMAKVRNKNIKFLAEKVEDAQTYEWAKENGFSLFQGYFFCKPKIISFKDIPSQKLNILQLIGELNSNVPDFDKLAQIIEKDVALTLKLLRLLNSAAFGFINEIKSIKHALSLLGIDEIRNWVMLLSLRELGNDKPSELTKISILRAKFAELLIGATDLKGRSKEGFLLGLISTLDGFTDVPMENLIRNLPISQDIKKAVLGEKGDFYNILQFTLAYERGKWDDVNHFGKELNIKLNDTPKIFMDATNWCKEILVDL